MVARHVVVVQEPLPAGGLVRSDAGGGGLAVGALRPGVGDRPQQPSATMRERGVQGVVVRKAAPVAVDVGAEVGVRLAPGDRRVVGRVGQRLGDVDPHQEVVPVGADVVQLRGGRLRELPLDSERPLLDVGVPRLRRLVHREEAVDGGRRHSAAGEAREELVRRLQRRRLAEGLRVVSAADVRIDTRGAVDLAQLGGVVEDPVAAADDRVPRLRGTVREADPGSEDLVPVGVLGTASARPAGSRRRRRLPRSPGSRRPPAGRPGRSRGFARPCGRSSRRARCGSRSAGPGSG